MGELPDFLKMSINPVHCYPSLSRPSIPFSLNPFLVSILLAISTKIISLAFTSGGLCLCHSREESPFHYFLDCFLYLPERQTLFEKIEHYIPNFPNLPKCKKLDIILKGIHIDNPDLIPLNTTLTIAVQNFILQTNRFS